MGARQVIRYAPFLAAALIASSTAEGQIVPPNGAYKVGDAFVTIERFLAEDAGYLSVHSMHLVRNGQIDTVVYRVFHEPPLTGRRSKVRGAEPALPTEITKEVANTPNYQVPLMNNGILVFISGDYEEGGKQQHVTRTLPRRIYKTNARTGPDGKILFHIWLGRADGRDVWIEQTYSIGGSGELREAIQSVSHGDTDLTPAILSGECKSIPLQDGIGIATFHVTPSPEGPPTITVTTR